MLSTEMTRQDWLDFISYATFTLGIVFLVYLGIILGLNQLINVRREVWDGQNAFQRYELYRYNYNMIITIVYLAFGSLLAYRRILRHYDDVLLNKVINHLTFIAEGDRYNYRIQLVKNAETNLIIHSINALIANTEQSIEEERRIEQTKDELIANVSHDIRTPLTSVMGYLSVLKQQQYQTDEEREHYIDIAVNKAEAMNTLINDLFYYIESSQPSFETNYQMIPIQFFLFQVVAEFELSAAQSGVRMEVIVEPEDLEVEMDPEKMVRVYSNFISNALKYGNGDLIRLIAYRGVGEEEGTVFLEVRNNGDLLEESEYEQIFERSYRTEKSRNTSIPGSGLGLSIVKNLVEAQNGEVYATVEDNETVFRVILEPPQSEEGSHEAN